MEPLNLHLQGRPVAQFRPDTDKIRRKLIEKGVDPTPKIVHILRKREIQKHNRKLKSQPPPPLTPAETQALEEDQHFHAIKREFRKVMEATSLKETRVVAGKPWEELQTVEFLEKARAIKEYRGGKLRRESLTELKEMFEERKMDELKWVFDADLEIDEDWFNEGHGTRGDTRKRSEGAVIKFLVDRLSDREITMRDWKFSRMMKLSGLPFTEDQLLKIVELLGFKHCWKQALSVVQWVYRYKDHRKFQSRFVYTKLLAVLGKAGRPKEALQIFKLMRENIHIYPDIAAYHSIAVTLGQAGLLKELLNIVECMRQKPKAFMHRKNWDPILEPDLVIYNAVLNACVPSKQWKGVSWVFKEIRKSGLKPNGATYGLAMEVMLESGNYDLVHEFFGKMKRSGEVPKALTYKVLVRTFWKEGKVEEAVKAIRDMERKGVIGTAGVYYELACCLCNCGRWRDAILEVDNIRSLPRAKPLEITFTGMIKSSMDGGHIDDSIQIFEYMKDHCVPNIGTINTMLKIFGQNDMFSKAKVLFEEVKAAKSESYATSGGGNSSVVPDAYTYNSMLEASASAQQWEYFEHVYREMMVSGYQLDQNKHLLLLVKASRAGKLHLLEHAFEMILEAGEIPHHLFFFELVIQAIVQHNYERAVILINTLAHAPFRVSEKQWTNLFKESEDRISHENLERLLDALGSCDVFSESTVSNLTRSLHVLCGLGAPRNFSSIIPFGSKDSVNGSGLSEKIDDDGNAPKFPTRMMIEGAEYENDIFVGSYDSATSACTHDRVNEGDNDDVMVFRPQNSDVEDGMSSQADRLECTDNLALDKSSDALDKKLWDDRSSEDDESYEDDNGEGVTKKKPTAYEILELWKELREEDGRMLQSELGHG
ncbi:pentatricopeptide repeat-containing protein At5g67570, chloroplastic-like isoform X1 [Vigna umbellata]|uniref:pentatricopeptide repeat-containing protein At5g67570, chloroplastic-like isoform X1 n=1 Tax=Vigna umbellata TaxID=87088 RepID=UPI001F5F8452|nr:pentatricopeptide repeat-containing protein At5g67570, chloroplastic-like isoform X1 [Vigna umbellata]